MEWFEVFVPGTPAPQGSKKHVGRGVLVEMAKGLPKWRRTVVTHVGREWHRPPLDGPVAVGITFVMPRPKSTPKRRTPPAIRRPDIDKLARAILDGLQMAGVITDDSRVTALATNKRLAELDETPGALISVRDLSASSRQPGTRTRSTAAPAVPGR